MADELMNLPPADAAPVLTLDPMTTQAPVMAELAPKPEEIPEDLSENNLTPEEKKMVEDFAKTIDVTNSNVILTYGAAAQKKIAGFSESALQKRTHQGHGRDRGDGVQSGDRTARLFSRGRSQEAAFSACLKRPANKIAAMKSKYDKAETNVDKICATQLEDHQIQLMKDVAMLDQMYQMNLNYFKELSMYILAGKKKPQRGAHHRSCLQLMEKAQQTGLPEDAQAANDLAALCNRFEKKTSRSGADPDDLHPDGAADPAGAGQRHPDDRENPVHAWSTPFRCGKARWCWRWGCHHSPAGHGSAAAGHRYDQ